MSSNSPKKHKKKSKNLNFPLQTARYVANSPKKRKHGITILT